MPEALDFPPPDRTATIDEQRASLLSSLEQSASFAQVMANHYTSLSKTLNLLLEQEHRIGANHK